MDEAAKPSGAKAGQGARQFRCRSCGAHLEFKPGTQSLACAHCGSTEAIEITEEGVEELNFLAWLEKSATEESTAEVLAVKCRHCGAETSFPPHVTADRCPFCAAPIVAKAVSRRLLRPRAVLPFSVPEQRAGEAFHKWIGSRWFAPNDLRRQAARERMDGAYLPAWTYDARTVTSYAGQRGDDYYVTQTYTAVENGRTVRKTRQVRHTRWTPVAGRVRDDFDDVLVVASTSVPRALLRKLEPWDLKNLHGYKDEYVSGFVSQSYEIDLREGFGHAKKIMAAAIENHIRRDIGGDHQRIHNADTRYSDVTFKYVLLPIWISAYRYREKSYRFVVNGRTGEPAGERPWSVWKITLASLAAALLALLAWWLAEGRSF